MASAEIAAGASSYTGNAALGGMDAGVIKIDTSPILQMAHYTVMYNKAKWEQANADAQNKLSEIAKLSTLNPNNAIPKDKDETLKAYNNLMNLATEYAKFSPKNNEEKIQKSLEFQAKMSETSNLITGANKRALGYQAQKIDVENNPAYNAKQKKILLDNLEKQANSTDIYTPISPTAPKFDLKVPKIGDPTYTKVEVLQNTADGNGKVSNTHTLFDPSANINASTLESTGLKDLQDRKPTTEMEGVEYGLENASDNSQQVWGDASNFLNQSLSDPKYKKDGQIDYNQIQSDNPIAGNIIALAKKWNEYSDRVKSDVAKGVYTDENGKVLVDPSKYFNIDVSKGISPSQLVFLEKFAKANPDALDSKYTHTGDSLAKQKNDQAYELGKMKASADAIYKRAMAGAAGTKARAYADNLKQQMKLRKTKAEQDEMLDGLFTRNITQQPTLYEPGKGGAVTFKINASTSLPMFTFDGSKPKQLIPIGATPIGMDGKPITSDAINPKVSHWEGGHFDTEYMVKGRPLSSQGVADLYQGFKANNPSWSGSYDDFIKTAIDKGKFDVRIIGANGATDKNLSIAAQRAISNTATGKGETPVFAEGDSNPPVDEVVPDNTEPDNE